MQLALIPPVSLIGEFVQVSDMQLILPEPWMHSEPYRWYMDHWRKTFKQYRILDNGAAEQETITDSVLMSLVEMTKADEFALPDVLGDAQATFDRSLTFLDRFSDRINATKVKTKAGFVTQGKDIDEAFDVTQQMMEVTDSIKTLFIPRLLVRSRSDARLVLAEEFKKLWPHVDIHLFGMSPDWPGEIRHAGLEKDLGIRSVDTAMPFYVGKGLRELPMLVATNQKPLPSRPSYYMYQVYTDAEVELVRKNVEIVQRWVNGE